jgi:hypothetical protein
MDAKVMRQAIKNISGKFDEAKVNTAHLLRQLTAKATTLEKLKAKVGQSTALSAFLQLNEMSDEEEEEDDLLKAGEMDYLYLLLLLCCESNNWTSLALTNTPFCL